MHILLFPFHYIWINVYCNEFVQVFMIKSYFDKANFKYLSWYFCTYYFAKYLLTILNLILYEL